MKKNKMMRLASGLLVAVLITTSTISGTYAKYVTEASAQDEARVAKWGVTVTAANDMFENTYTKHSAVVDSTGFGGDDTISVDASVDVVAPGTNGSLADFTIAGEPEVDVLVSYAATLSLEDWEVGGTYCPIVFTINGETYGTTNTTATNKSADAAALKTAVESAINSYSKYYNAGENLATAYDTDKLTVAWKWEFNDVASVTDPVNVNDTALGNAAAAALADLDDDTNPASIKLAVTCTIAQVD